MLLGTPCFLFAQGLDTGGIDDALGRSGQKIGSVYRVAFPRTDQHVSIGGLSAYEVGRIQESLGRLTTDGETHRIKGLQHGETRL